MIRTVTLLICLFGLAPAARSEVVYELFFRSSFGDSLDELFVVAPGERFEASVILQETVTGTSEANVGVNGLGGFGYRISTLGGDGSFEITARPNTLFTTFDTPDAAGGANFASTVAPVESIGNGVFEVNIGTVALTAPTLGAVTEFQLSDPRPASDFAGLGTGNNIEDDLVRFRSVTLSAIPEPSSAFALAGLAGCIVATSRRRRS